MYPLLVPSLHESIYSNDAVTLLEHHNRIHFCLDYGHIRERGQLRDAHNRIGQRVEVTAGLPRYPSSARIAFTSAIISSAVSRLTGARRNARSR